MSSRNMFDHSGNLTRGVMVMVVVAIMMSLLLAVGCSGSHKLNPTDPTASKQKKQTPIGETNGSLTQTQSGERGGGYTLSDDVANPMLDILHQLAAGGGGQGGKHFSGSVLVGVYDARTREPLIGAKVCAGNDGSAYGTIGNEGYLVLNNIVQGGIGVGGADLYISAVADNYEMVSYNKITNEVIAFLLNPLEETPVPTASVTGTFEFNTDNFLGDVYATKAVLYTDNILQPSGSGDTDDTFLMTVESGKPLIFVCFQRQPTSGRIIRFYVQKIPPLSEGSVYELNGVYDNNPLTGTNAGWVEYQGKRTRPYEGVIAIPQEIANDLETLDVEMVLYRNRFGFIPTRDAVTWINSPITPQYVMKTFNTTHMPYYNDVLPFQVQEVWINARYEDGSGTFIPMEQAPVLSGHGSLNLYVPPQVLSPESGALAVGLNPTISWTVPRELRENYSIITLFDPITGNRWRIYVTNGHTTTTLPTLCDNMSDRGLTVGNEVSMVIENDLSSIHNVIKVGDETLTLDNAYFKPRNYSPTILFTP